MKLEFVVARMAHAHRTFPDQSLILKAKGHAQTKFLFLRLNDMPWPISYSRSLYKMSSNILTHIALDKHSPRDYGTSKPLHNRC